MTGRHQILEPGKPVARVAGKCALAIMTKAPVPGKVKTRLCPPLTPTEAATLNIHFLQDIARSIEQAGAPGQGVGCYTPAGREDIYLNVLPKSFMLIIQRQGNFGGRLIGAIEDLLAIGFGSVCLINSDSPIVPAENFRRAAEILCQPSDSIVLGPSDDGGYYLIGMKKPHHRLFEEIDWSTDKVCTQTLERASQIQAEVCLLPATYDVDNRDAFERLCHDLLGPTPREAPATRQFLQRWMDAAVPS